jgi:hypothetical protein
MRISITTTVMCVPFLLVPLLFGDQPVEKAITKADEVLAIYREDWGLHIARPDSARGPFLILGVWKDGYIIWSDDRLNGGEPYHAGRIDPQLLRSFLSTFEKRGAFEKENFRSARIVPDSEHVTIFMRYNNKEISIMSYHELFESGGETVVVPRDGAKALDGVKLYDALRTQSSEYLLFRMIWNEIRARSAELVPSGDKSTKGQLRKHRGVVSWVEDSEK